MIKNRSHSKWSVAAAAVLLFVGPLGCGRGTASSSGDDDDSTTPVTSGGSDGQGGSANPTGGSSTTPTGGSTTTTPTGGAAPTGGMAGANTTGGMAGTSTTGGVVGAGGMGGPIKPIWPDGRGPSVAFTAYEAEAMDTNGTKTVPTRAFGRLSGESSGRQAVTLSQTGQQVSFKNLAASNSIVVRYSIPDGGHDYYSTIGVWVDGTSRGKLKLTSRYSWTYGPEDAFNKPQQEDKGAGNDHHFFDETHALIGDIPVGSTVILRKEADDTAATITIDLVEMEQVGGPLPAPAGALSLITCGAIPDDNLDDSVPIQKCLDQAAAYNKVLYIPPGQFQSFSKTLSAQNVKIQGAGMWYSAIVGFNAQINCWGMGNCKYNDFALFGDTVQRDDASPETAIRGNLSNSTVQNVWIEHVKVGIWPDKGSGPLAITSVRIRNVMADGINFYNGTHDSFVENSHIRNTGDDALAMWSDTYMSAGPSKNNVFRKNYVQVPWKANCFGMYGGQDNKIEDNVCADTVQYPGMFFAEQFNAFPFTGDTQANRNTLLRAGGNAYNHTHGALKFHSDQGPVGNIHVSNLDILDATNAGVHVEGGNIIDKVWLNTVTITNPGQASFYLNAGSQGSLDAVGVVATGGNSAVVNESGGKFNLIKGMGSTGW
ncbi:MAG TPA: glycosyl hydrolase family 28-related protein [Polyangiaceae bacterium]|nr:glycosyl hydrolase family 28-related protein [Polyangiaceae bacterium]